MLGKNLKNLTTGFTKRVDSRFKPLLPADQSGPQLPANATTAERTAFLEIQIAEAEATRARKKVENVQRAVSIPNICDFIENECVDAETVSEYKGTLDFSKATHIKLAAHQRRILNHVLTIDPETGRWPYLTVFYSAPKKSGKTGISAYVGAFFALYINSPSSVKVLANDQDQAADRALSAMIPTLVRAANARPVKNRIDLPNGSNVEALTNQPESEAGGHYILTLWTELWAFFSQRSRKLWAEMMPIATQPLSLRWVDSYAGYEDNSPLLMELFLEVFTDTTESELQPGARPVEALKDITTTDAKGNPIPCCYEVPEKGLFIYFDHEWRMPWQQDKDFFAKSTLGITETDINRLMYNRWQKTQSKFVTIDQLDASFKRGETMGAMARPQKMVFALDASWKHAHSGIVGVYEGERLDGSIQYKTGFAKGFIPDKKEGIDLEETLGAEVIKLWKAGLILRREPDPEEKKLVEEMGYIPLEVHYDPWQMNQVVLNLKKKYKILLKPFDQKTERLRSDTFLQLCYQNNTIDNQPDPALYKHLDNASAEASTSKLESERVRIKQDEGSKNYVDLAVCQSMAVWRLANRPRKKKFGSIGMGKAKGLI